MTSALDAPQTDAPTAFTVRAWLGVAAAVTFSTVIPSLYLIASREPPTTYQVASWLFNGLLFWFLLTRDRALQGLRSTPTDYGLLVLVAWPILVPYHFFSTRGRKGWRPFLIFAGIYLGLYCITAAIYVATHLITE